MTDSCARSRPDGGPARRATIFFDLTLLGPVDLRDSTGTSRHSVLSQTKRLALLAYLGASSEFVRRDDVIGVFWAELPEQRARHALSQAIYQIKRSLGRDVFATRGEQEIGLDRTRVRCDVVAFEAALATGDVVEAARRYAGELLAGFHLSDCRPFEEWSSARRAELRRLAADTYVGAAEQAEARGEVAEAAALCLRISEVEPYDQRLNRRAIEVLNRVGDRGAAVRACEDLVRRLQVDLAIEPAPETLSLLAVLLHDQGRESADGRPAKRVPVMTPPTGTLKAARPSEPTRSLAAAPRRSWSWSWAVAAVVVALGTWELGRTSERAPVRRFEISFPADQAPSNASPGNPLALDRDGTRLAYVGAGVEGSTGVWIRPLDAWAGQPVSGTEEASTVVFSPDGRSLAFVTGGTHPELRRVPATGGPPRVLVASDIQAEARISWSTDGWIYYVDTSGNLERIGEEGDERTKLVSRTSLRRTAGFANPDALPDGRGVLLTARHGAGRTDAARDSIAVYDLRRGRLRMLLPGIDATYLPGGFLVVTTFDGTLVAAPFDLRRLEITGHPAPVMSDVRVLTRLTKLALSRSGDLVYPASPPPSAELVWVDRCSGMIEPVEAGWTMGDAFVPTQVDLSPDGTRIVFSIESDQGREEIWVKHLGGAVVRLPHTVSATRPSWSIDGNSILFLSPSSGTTDYALWSRPADGTGEPRPLASPDVGLGEARWIPPDAAALVVRSSAAPWASDSGIYRLSLDSVDGPMIPFAVAPGVSFSTPTISPDGRYAAYVSDESGRAEVYVRSFPAADEAVRVSLDGGREPSWSAEETELFYKGGGDGKGVGGDMVVAVIDTVDGLAVRRRESLFEMPPGVPSLWAVRTYDVSADGERFVMLRDRSQQLDGERVSYHIVRNFIQEIRDALESR